MDYHNFDKNEKHAIYAAFIKTARANDMLKKASDTVGIITNSEPKLKSKKKKVNKKVRERTSDESLNGLVQTEVLSEKPDVLPLPQSDISEPGTKIEEETNNESQELDESPEIDEEPERSDETERSDDTERSDEYDSSKDYYKEFDNEMNADEFITTVICKLKLFKENHKISNLGTCCVISCNGCFENIFYKDDSKVTSYACKCKEDYRYPLNGEWTVYNSHEM